MRPMVALCPLPPPFLTGDRIMSRKRRRKITPDDLLRIVRVATPTLSPDGSRVLVTVKSFGECNDQPTELWLAPTDGEAPRRLTAGPRDRNGRFSPDERAVYFVRETEKGAPQLAVVPLDGGEAELLSTLPEGSMGGIRVSPAGTHVAFTWRPTDPQRTESAREARKESGATEPPMVIDDPWYRLDGDGYFEHTRWQLCVLDLASGTVRVLDDRDNFLGYSFDFSPDGSRIAYTTNRHKLASLRPRSTQIRIVDVATGKSRRLDWLPQGPKTALAWSPDGTKLAYAGRDGVDGAYSTENLELFVADLEEKQAGSLTEDEDICLMACILSDTAEAAFDAQLLWSRDSRRILARVGWHGEGRIVAFPIGRGRMQVLLEGHADVDLGDLDGKGRAICFMRSTPTELPEVHVAALRAHGALDPRRITHFNDELLSELDLADPKERWVRSKDGTRVHTWVMRPPGTKKEKRTPGILQVHGGPHALYGWAFFHEFQVLAARGWTVVYANPRGSKGYGRDHCHSIHGAWGTTDWVDINAVTRFMKKQKAIDTKRIGIMGGSYGGYMTNWAVSHSDDYIAAITDRCVSNMVSMMGSGDFLHDTDSYWEGNPWDRPEELWEQSPLKHFSGVTTPMLIIHSEGDLRCNIEQAEQVHTALVVQKTPCRFVRYPRETSHGFSRCGPPDMRLHRLGEIIDWWKRYI